MLNLQSPADFEETRQIKKTKIITSISLTSLATPITSRENSPVRKMSTANSQLEGFTTLIVELTTKVNALTVEVGQLRGQQGSAVVQTTEEPMLQTTSTEAASIDLNSLNKAKEQQFAQLQVNNPRVSHKTRVQAHDTLALMQAVPPQAMNVPQIATYVNAQLMANTATILNGEKFGAWIRTSLTAQTLGYLFPNNRNSRARVLKILPDGVSGGWTPPRS